jgi:hypothetical protein
VSCTYFVRHSPVLPFLLTPTSPRSAYVANLAAFLTRLIFSDVRTMEKAVALGYTICALPQLKTGIQPSSLSFYLYIFISHPLLICCLLELEMIWKDALFYYHRDNQSHQGMIKDYLAGACNFLSVGYEDTAMDTDVLEELCDKNLVFTDSAILDIPIALPCRGDLVNGLSYWIKRSTVGGITLQASKKKFEQSVKCDVYLSDEDDLATVSSCKAMLLSVMYIVIHLWLVVMFTLRTNMRKFQ